MCIKLFHAQLHLKHKNIERKHSYFSSNFVTYFILIITTILTTSGVKSELNIKQEDRPRFNANNSTDRPILVKFLQNDLKLSIHEEKNISFLVSVISDENISNLELSFNSSNNKIFYSIPNIMISVLNYTEESYFGIKSKHSGYSLITATSIGPAENMTDMTNAFLRLSIHYSPSLDYFSEIVGWSYFIAWSISFYPQTWLNWKRKSVIGLNFDFLSLNVVGFALYSIFNLGFYFIPEIQQEYFREHPFGVNPVQINDVLFSIHAFLACMIQVIQCIQYERGDQKISRTGRSLLGSFIISSIIVLILGIFSIISWINFLYFISYIKLFITLIKYVPQAYYNYLRKSTSGWSIGNVLLDFTGGLLSITQMIIIAFNYSDWGSIDGNLIKFGLGFISILFDLFFMFQHYMLYRNHDSYNSLTNSPIVTRSGSFNSLNHVSYNSITEGN